MHQYGILTNTGYEYGLYVLWDMKRSYEPMALNMGMYMVGHCQVTWINGYEFEEYCGILIKNQSQYWAMLVQSCLPFPVATPHKFPMCIYIYIFHTITDILLLIMIYIYIWYGSTIYYVVLVYLYQHNIRLLIMMLQHKILYIFQYVYIIYI